MLTMDRFRALIFFFFLILQLNNLSASSKTTQDKECIVKDSFVHNMQDERSINLTFFIAPKDPIKFHMSFVGRQTHQDNDLLILNPGSGEIQRKRNGKSSYEKFALTNSIPVGWINMTVTWQDNKLDLGIFYTMSLFETEINDISIAGKYMTDCAQRTPTWEISKSSDVSIPLIRLSHFEIILSSEQPFRPDLILNTLPIPIYYDEQLYFRKSIIPLPANDYRIAIVKSNNVITIFAIFNDKENQLLMKANTNEDLMDLRVKTNEGTFDLILDPFPEDEFVVETTIIKRSTEILEEPDLSPILEKSPAPTSSITWQIATAIASGIAVILFIIIIYLKRENVKKEDNEEINMEEGAQPLLKKDYNICEIPLKEIIKSKNTVQHGQINSNMNPHFKEVRKIKLKSDKKIDSKKMLGDLDVKKRKKVILVVGETGSGKSSFINGMSNFIYGVKYEDTFRFKLVDEMDELNSSGTNNTEEITAYCIPFMSGIKGSCNYIFIDTPGFGDSRGIDEDKKWNHKFYEFLKENPYINEVDGICFVMNETDTRLTETQRYIIDGLLSRFGKDIQNNMYVVVSHSDGSATHVPKLLKKSGVNYKLAIQFSTNGLYNDTEFESKSREDINEDHVMYWQLTMDNMKYFFDDLLKTNAVSLTLTNIVLEENKDIEKLKDELLELRVMENSAMDHEKKEIESKIEQNQELLMTKIDEAKKLDGRLKKITCNENPLAINDYIDLLMQVEDDQNKKMELEKLKDRNTAFNDLLKEKKSPNSLFQFIFGKKSEKTE